MDWKRRLPKAALVTLAGLLVLSGSLGFALAAGAPDVPDTFSVAEPRVGDRWGYESSFHVDGGEAGDDVEERMLEWQAGAIVYDAQGVPRHVQPLRDHSNNKTWYVDQEAEQIVASSWEASQETNRTHAGSFFVPVGMNMPGTQEQQHVRSNSSYIGYEGGPAPCGFFTEFQGRNVDLSKGVRIAGDCLGGDRSMHVFEAFGTDTIGEIDAVGFQATDGHNETRVWYHPDVPYPLRIQMHVETTWAAIGFLVGEGPLVYDADIRLIGFEAGEEEWGVPVGDLPPRLPAVDVAPMTVTGPDDAGVDHPYPLSMAFRNARESITYSDLRDFLAGHPDAQVVKAEGWTEQEEDADIHRWDFWVWGDGDRIAVEAERRVASEGSPMSLVEGATGPMEDYRTKGSGPLSFQFDFTTVTADRIPETVPRVASAALQFQSATGEPATTYGFDYTCFLICFTPLETALTVGSERIEQTASDGLAEGTRTAEAHRHRFHHAPDGELVWEERTREETEATWSLSAGTSPTMTIETGSPSAVRAGTAPVPWELPSPEAAAGATVLSLLLGALYWVWPVLKSGGALGLFSRVRPDELLDHPVRAALMQAVQEAPGSHYKQLLRASGKSTGVVDHHLRKLVDGGLVVAHRSEGFTCYFPRGRIDHGVMTAVPALKSGGAVRVLQATMDRPGLTVSDLARRVGIAKSTASHHVKRLRAAGLLEGDVRLVATPTAQQALALALAA